MLIPKKRAYLLFSNLCWAVWRCLVALTAGLVYLYLRREGNRSTRSPRILTPRDSYTIVSVTCPTNLQEAGTCAEWKRNLHERVLELVLMCSSAGRWRISKDDLAAYHRSRSARPEGARARRQRRSTVAFQNRVDARSDMEERSSSSTRCKDALPQSG